MISRLKRLFSSPNGQAYEIETHHIDGQTFRTFKNTLAMPVARRMAYYQALFDVELRVKGQDLDAFISLIRKELNDGNISRIGWLVENLAAYRELYTTRAILFEVACPIIMLHGEPVDDVKPSYVEKKRALCMDSDLVAHFFFHTAIGSLSKTASSSDITNIADYLRKEKTQKVETLFSKLIDRSTWGGELKS